MKGVQRFGVKGKLASRYVGPFPIIERFGPVAYPNTCRVGWVHLARLNRIDSPSVALGHEHLDLRVTS